MKISVDNNLDDSRVAYTVAYRILINLLRYDAALKAAKYDKSPNRLHDTTALTVTERYAMYSEMLKRVKEAYKFEAVELSQIKKDVRTGSITANPTTFSIGSKLMKVWTLTDLEAVILKNS